MLIARVQGINTLQETTHHETSERFCIKLFPSTYPLALSRAITTESRKGIVWVSIPSKFDFQIPLNTKIKVMGKFYVKASTVVDTYISLYRNAPGSHLSSESMVALRLVQPRSPLISQRRSLHTTSSNDTSPPSKPSSDFPLNAPYWEAFPGLLLQSIS